MKNLRIFPNKEFMILKSKTCPSMKPLRIIEETHFVDQILTCFRKPSPLKASVGGGLSLMFNGFFLIVIHRVESYASTGCPKKRIGKLDPK